MTNTNNLFSNNKRSCNGSAGIDIIVRCSPACRTLLYRDSPHWGRPENIAEKAIVRQKILPLNWQKSFPKYGFAVKLCNCRPMLDILFLVVKKRITDRGCHEVEIQHGCATAGLGAGYQHHSESYPQTHPPVRPLHRRRQSRQDLRHRPRGRNNLPRHSG